MRDKSSHLPPPPSTMPAYAPDISLDVDGNLWVREYTGPGQARAPWSVFTESGRFLGTVDMPAGLSVLDIGGDYVLGLRRDKDDVEHVQLYELIKP